MRIAVAMILLGFYALCWGADATTGDLSTGESLIKQHCTMCHGDSVYQRPNRRVKSIGALIGQVDACAYQLNLDLSDAQKNDIVHYLNEGYYQF